ncbi:prolyl oligopeptidase family serine peptidase [Allosphingosinicella sp.]|uniref:prolyl oligopeptidase family serine peptidase n=1 Tax=Allosphingosinicella sp. TaxID=2823234 RepID=UPI002F05E4AD
MKLGMYLLAGAISLGSIGASSNAQPASTPAQPATPAAAAADEDPFLFLEEIEGERALAWARAENERTLGELQADPRYQQFYDRALEILQARDRIPFVAIRPSGLYNFWQDQDHVRGILRRTTLASYRTENPQWETVLDVDALATAENANWVYQGMSCLPPAQRRCLVTLSNGGRDANFVREFDLAEGRFVAGGFSLPEGKQNVAWVDENTILVARDFGEGTMSTSGYPITVRRLSRGQALDQAQEVFRGTQQDVRVFPFVLRDARGRAHASGVGRAVSFFENEWTIFTPRGNVVLPIPRKASPVGIVDGRVLFSLDEPWEAAPGLSFATDSVVSYDLNRWKRDPVRARPSLVWAPGPRQTLSGAATTRNTLLLTSLDNVRGRAFTYNYVRGAWRSTPVPLPQNATVGIAAASDENDLAMFTVTDFLDPTSLYLYDAARAAAPERIKTTPPRFNAAGHMVEQFEATSRDGTKIPYFVIRPRNAPMDGSTPTLLYGYGGFQSALTPGYLGTTGRLWLEGGNAWVVANLRGGGEFGPEWHQTAQRANKQRTWDDYIAVAEDVIARRLTSPRRLGVVGGSQGGLLVGTAITQRPELFNAAIIQVPLFDMMRYHLLGAGASWIGEYGDPRIAEQRAWISGYSPYQRLTPGRTYPTPFIHTSTADDRVHPGHGRKAAARLAALGQPYYYYENMQGGHSAAANLQETARRLALEYTYASKRLVD